ncbi:MAG: carboxypeptidase-like regulatory domain-containing protein [Nanoarchaeota archaeon]
MHESKLARIPAVLIILAILVSCAPAERPIQGNGPQAACERARGIWTDFDYDCADTCADATREDRLCSKEQTEGCDCGEGRCWNGISCVDLSFNTVPDAEPDDEQPADDGFLMPPMPPSETGQGAPSGIHGEATIGPQCPVAQFPTPSECEDKPYQTELTIIDEGGYATRITTDADGRFSAYLGPGSYTIYPEGTEPDGVQAAIFPRASPMDVEVRRGQWTQVTIMYDTGIR